MKTLRILFLILIIGLAGASLAACAGVPEQLTTAEQLWQDQNLTNYDFTLERQCFCPEEVRGPVNVQVRDGVAVSIIYVSTGQAVNGGAFDNADTMEKLFTILKDGYTGKGEFNRKADTITVTYDPDRGYPQTFFIDISEQIADEENGYTVTNFTPR